MEANPRPATSARPVRQPILLGLFAGAGVAVGYLLAGVPAVELMSLVACLAGVALGPWGGALAGGLAEAVYSLGSPYGPAAPPLLAAQVLGVALPGVLGGVARPWLLGSGRTRAGATLAGALGLAAAAGFDVLTNIGIILGYGLEWRVVAAGAVVMALVHGAVTAAIFAAILPAAAPRAALLARGALRGGAALALAAVVLAAAPEARAQAPADAAAAPAPADTTATAAVDSSFGRRLRAPDAPPPAAAPAAPTGPAALGWKRELWSPFATQALNWLDWHSPRTTAVEAGVAGPALVMGEGGAGPAPLVTVDDVPWSTGHALADDPWLIPQQGLAWQPDSWFADGTGGTDGRLSLVTADVDPARSVSNYHGVKGRHESYTRGVDVLSAEAPWRVSFAFEENLDNEAWNYTRLPDELFRPVDGVFNGHGKVRQSRTRLVRSLDRENRLAVEFSNARLTRNDVPAWNADQREIWDTGVAAVMDGAGGAVRWHAVAHWRDRDVQWSQLDDRGGLVAPRKVETGREGLILELQPRGAGRDSLGRAPAAPLSALRFVYDQWAVADRADTLGARPIDLLGEDGRGRHVLAEARTGRRFGGSRGEVALRGVWDERIDIAPGFTLAAQQDAARPAWRLELAGDGRAPRSDELLTSQERYIDGRSVLVLANRDLGRERTLRAGVVLQGRLLGTGLALDASVRRLRDGIMWVALPGQANEGRWQNGLALDAVRVTGRIEREGRFLGWGRALLEATWQQFDESGGRAPNLPPEASGRAALFWENHFFQEDGILQLGLVGWRRGAMDDPWDVTRAYRLPAITTVDLLVGFRLVGAHLSLNFKNLTGQKHQLTAGTWSSGQEMDMRLMWSFRH